MKYHIIKFFIFIIGIFYLFSSLEYINADGYEHIKRLCDAQLEIKNWAYYHIVSYINTHIFMIDSCEYFNSLDESYFQFNILDTLQKSIHINFTNSGKILVSGLIWLFSIFFLVKKNNITEVIAVLTTPFLFFSLMSSSSDVLVASFSLILFLYLNQKKYIISFILIILMIIYTDKSSLYVALVYFYVLLVDKFNVNYKTLIIIFIIQYLSLEVIKINPQILNFQFIYDLNLYKQYIANSDHGSYFIFAFPISIFSIPNFKLVNIIGLIYFMFLFLFYFNKIETGFLKYALCYFIPFYLIASLVGGVSMARHYPLFGIYLIFGIIKSLPKLISYSFIAINLIFIVLANFIYLNI